MSSAENLSTLVENITNNEEIDTQKLKNVLKIMTSQIDAKSLANFESELHPFRFNDIKNQAYKLADLIDECEDYIERLIQVPKTRIVIRNEGQKLDSIIDTIDELKDTHAKFQTEIDYNSKTLHELKRLKCHQPKKFYDVANCLEIDTVKSDVCNIKKKLCTVENQIEEINVKIDSLEEDVKDIHKKIEHVHLIPDLVEKVNMLLDWRAQLREDIEMMTERYEHVKTIKVSKCDLCKLIENKVNYEHLSRYVLVDRFNLAKDDFRVEFEDLKQLFCELQMQFTQKLVDLHKEVQILFTRLGSKTRLEKRSLH